MNMRKGVLWAVGVVLALSSGAAGKAAGDDWQPLEIGFSWSYGVARDNLITIGQQPGQTVHSTGTSKTEVMGRSKQFKGPGTILEVVSAYQEQASGGPARSVTVTNHLSKTEQGVFLYGQSTVGAPGVPSDLVTYRPPLQVFALPATPGLHWTVGAMRQGSMQLPTNAEVAGFESITGLTSKYDRCLKIHYTGTVSGSLPSPAGELPITGGSVDTTDYYAAGLGMVKEVSVVRVQFTLPNGMAGSSTQTTTRVLTKATVKS